MGILKTDKSTLGGVAQIELADHAADLERAGLLASSAMASDVVRPSVGEPARKSEAWLQSFQPAGWWPIAHVSWHLLCSTRVNLPGPVSLRAVTLLGSTTSIPSPHFRSDPKEDFYRSAIDVLLSVCTREASGDPVRRQLLLEYKAFPDLVRFVSVQKEDLTAVQKAKDQAKNLEAVQLLSKWLDEDEALSDDQDTWKFLKTQLDRDRSSNRKLFP